VADAERALQRGAEVDRFNDLVRRQDSLTPEESDELYRFRIRRLNTTARLVARAVYLSEEELRDALDRYDGRLAALRAFEEVRRANGLSTGHAVDPAIELRGSERLLELGRQRPHGLIAGAGEPPRAERGGLRVPVIALTPSDRDVPLYVLAPPSLPAESLARSVEAVAAEGARVQLVREPADIPRGERMPLVLNWGSANAVPSDLVTLNRAESVRIASDQVESLRRLAELAPKTVLHPADLQLLGAERVVAKRRQGSRGSGKAVLAVDAPAAEFAGFDLYQEHLPNRREWRVSMLSGRVVSGYLKKPPAGTSDDALHPDWTFRRSDVLPRSVVRVAREAASRIGLDYAGVDVVEDLDSGRVLCLEANAAPGMSADTLRSLYGHVQRAVRGRQRRAA
jgi:hypothetical protein